MSGVTKKHVGRRVRLRHRDGTRIEGTILRIFHRQFQIEHRGEGGEAWAAPSSWRLARGWRVEEEPVATDAKEAPRG